ncbi:hypothetical protein HDU67_002232, partial [Dinochytrium kinnereticum]
MDLPYRDRYGNVMEGGPKEDETGENSKGGEEGPDGTELDDLDVFDDSFPEGVSLDDGDEDVIGSDSGGEEIYQELTGAKRRKVKETNDLADNDESLYNENDFAAGEKRASTWEMLTNKGLTPHRKKENRNPRVKKRLKFEQAKKKLKSVRAVAADRSKIGPYRGELTGIKTSISKIIKSVYKRGQSMTKFTSNGAVASISSGITASVISKSENNRPAPISVERSNEALSNRQGKRLIDILPEFNTNRRTADGDSVEEAKLNDAPAANMLSELLSDLCPSATSPGAMQRERFGRADRRRSKMFKDFRVDSSNEGILSDYRLDRTIGEGCFSKVKLAMHIPTQQKVAMKCIDKSAVEKAVGSAERILREILVLTHLYHENITRLLEVVETANYIYLALEYESGGELFDYILAHDKVPEDMARKFFRQMISAIQYCHANGIAHRDLKPENILLDANSNVKLIDFGFSNVMRNDKGLETFCGSAAYAAPEMISRKQYKGNEADIWSLGVILFVMLCGHLPFDDRSNAKMFTAIVMGRYTFPENFPEGAKDLVSKILKTKPAERATLEIIRDHPWINNNGELPTLSFFSLPPEGERSSKGDPQSLEDEDIMQEILRIGYSQEEIDDALASRNPGPVLAAYHLVRAERNRSQASIVSISLPVADQDLMTIEDQDLSLQTESRKDLVTSETKENIVLKIDTD